MAGIGDYWRAAWDRLLNGRQSAEAIVGPRAWDAMWERFQRPNLEPVLRSTPEAVFNERMWEPSAEMRAVEALSKEPAELKTRAHDLGWHGAQNHIARMIERSGKPAAQPAPSRRQ